MQQQSVKATLPGDMYQRAGRWWWRVKLPGEHRPRARALKTPGAKAASRDLEEAQTLAVTMWEQAIRQEESRRVTLEYEQKVERLKARFLDKVQSLTEIVRGASAKAEAEVQARAEIKARLDTLMQAAERKAAAPVEERRTAQIDTDEREPTRTEVSVAVDASPCSSASAIEDRDLPPQTGTCGCCGAENVPAADLKDIDSGQRLCPPCLKALHYDISRIESRNPGDSRV